MPILKRTRPQAYALAFESALALKPQLESKYIAYKLYQTPAQPDLLWLSLEKRASTWLKAWLPQRPAELPAMAVVVDWQDLPGLDLLPEPRAALGPELLIRTIDRSLLLELMAEHVRLGEGELAISASKPGQPELWLLRILQPSHWLLAQLPESPELRFFCPAGERPGLYLERGYRLRHPRLLELFRWDPRQVLLLDGKGVSLQLQVSWQPVRQLIALQLPAPRQLSPRTDLKLELSLRLVAAPEPGLPRLWRIDEPARLEALLAESSAEQLQSFQLYLSEQGPLFCQMLGLYGDAGLAERLSRQFPAWWLLQQRVFLPLGWRLQPRLSEEELLNVLAKAAGPLQPKDRVCFQLPAVGETADGPAAGETLILSEKGWKPAQAFISYRVEQALSALPAFASQWEFTLGELVERGRQQALVLRGGAAAKPVELAEAAVAAPLPAVGEAEPVAGFEPVLQNEEVLVLRRAVREIDERLLEHFSDPALWRERAALCLRLRLHKETLLCRALAAVIEGDNAALLELLRQAYPQQLPGLGPLFSAESLDEESKGRLLGLIRQSLPCAEERYLLQLWYAARCGDQDVFAVNVEAMRRGESVAPAPFHDFGLGGESASQVLVLNFDDAEALSTAVLRYRRMLKQTEPDLQAILLEQFRLLLKAHHPQPQGIDALLPRPLFASGQPLWQRKWGELKQWPQKPNHSRAAAYWADRIELPGLQGARLQDLFTGEAYRPDFTAEFRAEAEQIVERLYLSYLGKEQPPPEISKGGLPRPDPMNPNAPDYWREFFTRDPASDLVRSRNQRILLYLCQAYGPLADFQAFVHPPDYEHLTEFSRFVRHCDFYRLSRLFDQPLDETVFFPRLLDGLDKMARSSLIDFRDAAENLVSCLFLSRSGHRETWIEILLHLILREAGLHADNAESERGDELLSTVVYIELDLLLSGLSSGLQDYQHFVRRRALWMEHAHSLKAQGLAGLVQTMSEL